MEIPSYEELQQMSDSEIADLNFMLSLQKMERLSILVVIGGAAMYGISYLAQRYFEK